MNGSTSMKHENGRVPKAVTAIAKASRRKFILFAVLTFAAWLLLTLFAEVAKRAGWSVAHITGYGLFTVILALIFFKARKRLLVLPLGTIRDWLVLHLVLGAASIPLYFQHTGTLWPQGRYEQCIALAFYVVSLSAVLGVVLQRVYPRRLADLGSEVIFERIPTEIANLREEAEALVLKATKECRSDTLARYYAETMQWFFLRPRFVFSLLFSTARSAGWIQLHVATVRRYLNDSEAVYLKQLQDIAHRKSLLDAHYAMQGALKLWLFVHVPAAVLLVLLASWHLIVINIYAR